MANVLFDFLQGRQGPRRGGGLLASEIETDRESPQPTDMGLLGPRPQRRPASLLSAASPGPSRRQAAAQRLRQAPQALQATPQPQQGPFRSVRPEEAQQALTNRQRRQQDEQAMRAQLAQGITGVTGRELTKAQQQWISEAAADSIDSGVGRSGTPPLSRVAKGDLPPGLSERERKLLTRRGLMLGGLSILSSNRQGLAKIAEGLTTGLLVSLGQQQAMLADAEDDLAAERVRRNQQTARAAFQQTPADLPMQERWRRAVGILQNMGRFDAAEVAAEQRDLVGDLGEQADHEVVTLPDGSLATTDGEGNFFRPGSGERIEDPSAFQAQAEAPQTSFERRSVPGVGVVEFELDQSGQVVNRRVVQGLPQEQAGGGDGQLDPETATIANQLDREIANIRSVLGDDPDTEEVEGADRFGITGSFGRLARLLPAELEPSDLKQLKAATQNALSIIIKARSGAQASDKEVERLQQFASPLPGDDPETVRTKLERLENIVRDFRRTGSANAAVDPIMQGGAQSEDDILEEIYGGS